MGLFRDLVSLLDHGDVIAGVIFANARNQILIQCIRICKRIRRLCPRLVFVVPVPHQDFLRHQNTFRGIRFRSGSRLRRQFLRFRDCFRTGQNLIYFACCFTIHGMDYKTIINLLQTT